MTEIGTSTPVSFWADRSGNGNNATQPTGSQQPLWVAGVLNGLPVVRFNPTNSQYFNLPNVLNGTTGAEAFVVLKVAVAMPIVTRSLWGFGGYYNDYPSPIGTYGRILGAQHSICWASRRSHWINIMCMRWLGRPTIGRHGLTG